MSIKIIDNIPCYECHSDGYVRLIGNKKWRKGAGKIDKQVTLCGNTYYMHHIVYQCFKGEIPEGYEVDHIDNNPQNNNIDNLQVLTIADNRKKRNRDFLKDIGKNAYKKTRPIKIINLETNEILKAKNKNQASKIVGCSPALVYLICEKKENAKTYMKKYTFEYLDENVINENDFVNVKSDDFENKQNSPKSKLYKCECGKTIKIASKEAHEKTIHHMNSFKEL